VFDPKRFVELVRNGLLDAETTWAAYRAEERPWQYTASHLTVPLILGSMLAAGLIAWLLNSGHQFGGIGPWLLTTVLTFVQFGLAVAIFTGLAGAMGGRRDFDRGTAALSLAAIPAYVGNALSTVPWIGWLISLGLAVLAVVYLYRIIPLYLDVPQSKRVTHFVVSLLALIVASLVIGAVGGVSAYREYAGGGIEIDRRAAGTTDPTQPTEPRGGGFIGEIQRTAAIYEAATADNYDPPANGRLSQAQVEEYVRVMTRARAMQDEYADRMEALAEEIESKEETSFSDLAKIYRGAGGVVGAGNAAMEIVKTSGGNWAEHVWVEEQLRVARFQPDASDAAASNRKLYDKYAEALAEVAAF
jgi:hypothetical protein